MGLDIKFSNRRGKFKRIFPAANVNDYKNFFENDRPFNKLLRTV